MNIALLEPLGVSAQMIEKLAEPLKREGHTFTYYPQRTTDPQELLKRSAGKDVVMIANTPYPNDVIRQLPELKMIDVAFTGIDHIGQDACKAQGVTICNAANYSNQTVAELVIGLTLGLYRQIDEAQHRVRTGGTAAGILDREIAGKTVGIVGTGRIGMMTAKLFHAFGARLIAYSHNVHPEAATLGMTYMPLEQLMAEADIVSIHTPNNPSTKGMISKEMLALMKPTAILINCARGPILDNQALAEALNSGKIAGAGIDVYDMEPPIPADYPLLNAKNTLLTPHVAFASEESMIRRAEIVFENLYAFLKKEPQNVCN